ncbi:ABC transporter substrate-binding protein [Acuticoccus sp. I52.16.1]|uniref:ABC transporter substrate-binding protein n=1 Tax=Acuticoccus sp. I52.16.1 TaxID=2928472 RepID=UPI001FD48A12|nr:ABC transporter substrate-binding protein [Acuticoccus sp. I52.16.1]UOM34220.1 ABC transporter substrate-binding protein [Acuticoccus sp. I52.16.1]
MQDNTFRAKTAVSRRTLLKGAGAAGLALGAGMRFPTPAIAQTKTIKFTLPWLANGSTLFTYVAKNQGFFKDKGLDVEISRGYGSVAAAQALGAGEFDFGFVFAGGIILGAARGLPLKGLATLGYDATMGMLLKADSEITEPKDFEGKKIGMVPTSAEAPYWPAFARKTGIDTSGVTIVQMDNRVLEQSVINDQVASVTAIATSSVPVMMSLDQPTRFMLWSKYGVSLYAGQVATQAATYESDPELCAAVTEALTEGLVYALKDPQAGVDIFVEEVPEIGIAANGRENARLSQGLMHYTVVSTEAEEHAIGYTDMEKVGEMVDMVMEFGAPADATRPDPAALYTNDVVSEAGKLSADEWASIKSGLDEYAKILG